MKMSFYGCTIPFTSVNKDLHLYFADDYVLFDLRGTCFECNGSENYPFRTLAGKVNVVVLLDHLGCTSDQLIQERTEWGGTFILSRKAHSVQNGRWKGRTYDDEATLPGTFAELLAMTEPAQPVPA